MEGGMETDTCSVAHDVSRYSPCSDNVPSHTFSSTRSVELSRRENTSLAYGDGPCRIPYLKSILSRKTIGMLIMDVTLSRVHPGWEAVAAQANPLIVLFLLVSQALPTRHDRHQAGRYTLRL